DNHCDYRPNRLNFAGQHLDVLPRCHLDKYWNFRCFDLDLMFIRTAAPDIADFDPCKYLQPEEYGTARFGGHFPDPSRGPYRTDNLLAFASQCDRSLGPWAVQPRRNLVTDKDRNRRFPVSKEMRLGVDRW